MRTFYLVRHGTTEWVENRILHGITDIPLNELGMKQAQAAARALAGIDASRLYTSTLSRCVQTAQPISQTLGLDPIGLDGLRELDFGWLEGRPTLDHNSPEYSWLVKFWDRNTSQFIRLITGEPIRKFQSRVRKVWEHILAENPDGSTVVVGHSGVFNALLIHYFDKNFPPGQRYYRLRPGSISQIDIDRYSSRRESGTGAPQRCQPPAGEPAVSIQAVIFDLAGVLLHTIRGTFASLMAERLGVTEVETSRLLGTQENDMWDMGEMNDDEFFTFALELLNLPINLKPVLEKFVVDDFCIDQEMLAAVHELHKSCTTALLTNFPSHVHTFMQTVWRVDGAFDHIIASCEPTSHLTCTPSCKPYGAWTARLTTLSPPVT
jgi:broad specificity phosphatase PhoE